MMSESERRKRKKQPTRPKIRGLLLLHFTSSILWLTLLSTGCYNCSQRRVSCDRATPQCQKCVNAGLPCPGLGPRIRFVHGIASRGKFKNKPAPLAAGIPDDPPVDPQPESREEPRPSQTQCNPESQLVVLAPWRPQLTIYYPLDHMSGCERSLLHYCKSCTPGTPISPLNT